MTSVVAPAAVTVPLKVTVTGCAPVAGSTGKAVTPAPIAVFKTTNDVTLAAVPSGVVTVRRPVDACAGTVVTIVVGDVTWKAAETPKNFTEVAPPRLVPVMVTLAPTRPLGGEKPVISGNTPKLVAL